MVRDPLRPASSARPGARRPPAAARHALAPAAALWLVLAPAGARADGPAPVPGAEPPAAAVEVRVERVRPMKEKRPTLRFLRENRDFIRGRFDRLRETPVAGSGEAAAMDPRFLAYRELLAAALAAGDSVAAADDARARRDLFESITRLGELEQQLDLMDRLLAEQRGRLAVLQADFTGDQGTELAVVVSGEPGAGAPAEIAIALEDGTVVSVPLGPEHHEALRRGGVVRVLHALVEPRAQVVDVTLRGAEWPGGDTGYVALEPARDRLTLLHLDLSTLDPRAGAPSLRASAWLHDASLPDGRP